MDVTLNHHKAFSSNVNRLCNYLGDNMYASSSECTAYENCTSSNLELKPNIIQNFVTHLIIQLCTLTQNYKDTRTYKHGSPHKEPERFREMESETSVSRKLSPSHLYHKIFALCWHKLQLSQQTQALTIDIFICTIIIIYLVW